MSFDFKYNYPQIARDSGFKLRQFRDGPLDWRIVGSLEVERIVREHQFEHIDAVLFYLSEAPLASMLESNVLDSGIAKYFILSQLAIQYLIFCRKFLDETVCTLRESLVEKQIENVNLKTINQEHSNEILQLHKKISQIEAIHDIIFPCHICTKNFVSNDALNIHLSKKHSKSPTGDIQCKDNDRTLINTIKLELEIKQLKERLNIAEKGIRETVDSKKGTLREVTKTCSSTQINTATNDVGTQSNLFETKESDCAEDEKGNKVEIISQLQEKITKLENWQESQQTVNQQSINDITQKLSEITESLQSRSEHDVEKLTKLAKDAILSSISTNQVVPASSKDELQNILSSTVSEAIYLNSEKLNEILSKIETIYEEKLPSLKMEIQKGRILAQEHMKEAISANMMTKLPEKQMSEEKDSSTLHSPRTYSIERFTHENPSDSSSTDMTEEVVESQESEVENKPTTSKYLETTLPTATNVKKLAKTIEKKMTSYGINSAAKTISASEANKISVDLAEDRNSLKKIYPRFYATRNKLTKLVDRLSSQKRANNQIYSASLPDLNLQEPSAKNTTKINKKSDYLEKSNNNDDFKMRLEKILSSPIKKPTTYVPTRMPELIKPIPMPRKRVMFNNAEDCSTGNEISYSVSRLSPRYKI